MATESTDLAVAEKPKKAQIVGGGKLAAMIPTDVDQAYRMAQAISRPGMTPQAYGNDADKFFVGTIAGVGVGLATFTARQTICVPGQPGSATGRPRGIQHR